MHAGPAFQITDDLLDLTSGKGRGEIGRDIKEGKRSMLVVYCLQKCNSSERKKLLEILNKLPRRIFPHQHLVVNFAVVRM